MVGILVLENLEIKKILAILSDSEEKGDKNENQRDVCLISPTQTRRQLS